jgi:hypothetical protein
MAPSALLSVATLSASVLKFDRSISSADTIEVTSGGK